jgi:hypothetical protein
MTEAIDRIRSLLEQADQALSRQCEAARTPRQRDEDFAEAQRAHREAVAIVETLRTRSPIDDAFVAALAPLQVELADLEILMSEIRFDESELTQRLPRLRAAGA